MIEPVAVGGIDPGPRPGLVVLHISGKRLLRLERGPHLTWERVVCGSEYVALETYVRGPGSARRQDAAAQLLTQSMAQDVKALCARLGRTHQAVPAGVVKPWATDDRLKTYTLTPPRPGSGEQHPSVYELTRGQGGHDRDAARGALYFAVKLGLLGKK